MEEPARVVVSQAGDGSHTWQKTPPCLRPRSALIARKEPCARPYSAEFDVKKESFQIAAAGTKVHRLQYFMNFVVGLTKIPIRVLFTKDY